MKAKGEKIALGAMRLELRPLKLGQLRHVLDALNEMVGKSEGDQIVVAAKILAAGVAPAHPDMTAEQVLDTEATLEELRDAVAAVLRVAGLRSAETGEAEPQPGQTLPTFTALSPPAAAILTP